jgi:hypothetical protein
MSSVVRPELPTASVGSSQAPTAAVDNSAPYATRPQSTYKSGKAVQTNGATSASRSTRAPGDSRSAMYVTPIAIAASNKTTNTWNVAKPFSVA